MSEHESPGSEPSEQATQSWLPPGEHASGAAQTEPAPEATVPPAPPPELGTPQAWTPEPGEEPAAFVDHSPAAEEPAPLEGPAPLEESPVASDQLVSAPVPGEPVVIPAPDGAEFVPSSLDDPSFAASPPSPPAAGSSAILPRDRPELAIGGAFAGGLVLALILKRLAR